ncbi:MAG: terpene cyclase/mutase family protein [Verrucomicrobia bacterium]|nr:terpene cyclase/mutase family protein [Verrucomicrobiota bacterium]
MHEQTTASHAREPWPRFSQRRTLRELMGATSLREYIIRIRAGLKQPKDSGAYKFAMRQLVRVWAPVAGVVLPLLFAAAIAMAPKQETIPPTPFSITRITPREPEPTLDAPVEIEQPSPVVDSSPPPPLPNFSPSDAAPMPDAAFAIAPGPAAGPESVPMAFTPTLIQPSPGIESVMRLVCAFRTGSTLSNRSSGAREQALAEYGTGSADTAATEHAVYLALRWLKKYQEENGSWLSSAGGGDAKDGATPAMTALALLAFLAHGETPDAEEFGATVERAIRWLVDNQDEHGHFRDRDTHDYTQPIVTYALSEAFSLTRVPMVKAAAEKAATVIVKGQNPYGGLWDYNCVPPKADMQPAADRNDLSYAAWCMQALKAASMAGLEIDGLSEALQASVAGTKRQRQPGRDGASAFGYSRIRDVNGPWEITGAGVLCLQLLGAGKSPEAQEGLRWLQRATCTWDAPWGASQDGSGAAQGNPIYHWYYVTQAMFHAGGATWEAWNKQFSPELVRNQSIVANAIMDRTGKPMDIGYWKPAAPSECSQSYVYNTALCALMLQVYYRYLPTYRTMETTEPAPTTLSHARGDVDIRIL